MTESDQARWDARYAVAAFAGHAAPNGFLRDVIGDCPTGRALDVACGAGRNAVFLAEHGFAVDALDISGEGLARGQELAQARGVRVRWQRMDLLATPQLPRRNYQLIVMLRFVAPQLLRQLPEHLAPGGMLVVEQHLRWPQPVDGPHSERFRVAPGELRDALATTEVIHYFEGVIEQPGGAQTAVARVLARRPL